MYVIN